MTGEVVESSSGDLLGSPDSLSGFGGKRPRIRDRTSRQQQLEVQGIRGHVVDQCLHCCPKGTVLNRHTDSESGFEDGTFSSPCRSRTETQTSQTSVFSTESSSAGDSMEAPSKNFVRKEMLRLICQLTVRPKYAEKGLLRLRQEYPLMFSTICLYCDVCCVMTGYQFKLSVRRFIQELFQEVDFSELCEEPMKLFGKAQECEDKPKNSENDQKW